MANDEGTISYRRRTIEMIAMIGLIAIFIVISIFAHDEFSRETIGIIIAAGLTLTMYSFLYRDNPFYKIAENLYVGVTTGYMIIIMWQNYLRPEVYDKFFDAPTQEALYEALMYRTWPVIFGILILMRLSKKYSWASRYSYALMVGWGAGLIIVTVIDSYILRQLEAAVKPLQEAATADGGAVMWFQIASAVFALASTVAVLWYFFFSLEHKGIGNGVSKFGILVLMISFGASFGYTVMARLSLLIGRMQFLIYEWLAIPQ